jgi:hypothetical protein
MPIDEGGGPRLVELLESFLRLRIGMPDQQAEQLAVAIDKVDDWWEDLNDVVRDYLNQHRNPNQLNIQI